MTIKENLEKLRKELAEPVTLVAVSKTMPVEIIREAYNAGQQHFGENRVQELITKKAQLPQDIKWHLIGHLQSNKVKYIVPFVYLIHSVDSLKLMRVIDREAAKINKKQQCLFQIHIAEEESKFGFDPQELLDILHGDEWKSFTHIQWCGVMGMATFTEDMEQVRKEFRKLYLFYAKMRDDFFPGNPFFKELSMGMSGDYPVAVEEGATMVRIGTRIFGSRQ